ELLKAFRRVLARAPIERHKVKAEHYHVKDRMKELAVRLSGSERISFDDVFEASTPRSRAWLIVTFLAVLELVRLKMLKVVQAEQFATIHLLPQNHLSVDGIDGAQIDWDMPKASEEPVPDTAQEALPLEEPASEPEPEAKTEEPAPPSEDAAGSSDEDDELDGDEEDWDEDEEDELEYDLEDTDAGEDEDDDEEESE
ncbi:MAG: segregation/condensation protein A, partial [Bdellovibrionota bacterium]